MRDKRVAIKVKMNESYRDLLPKAIRKLRTFHKDLLNSECEHVLTFENGDIANIIPSTTEEYTLSKYKEKIGKDFKSIVLFWTSANDQKDVKKYQLSHDLFSDFNDREMLLTNVYGNINNKEENANDLFDELALVNPFTNVKENIKDNYVKKVVSSAGIVSL